MNSYLEKFFPDNPITVEIRPFKETKKKEIKNCIDIVVGYKGENIDIESLSGGEYDRVVLSIVLSLNNIFGSELLMLDESISSLDDDASKNILYTLKDDFSDRKLVVMVSHQTEHGLFDKIVQL
jgi:DNA repair exonuclease SbcCD ATPase subunit